MRGLVARLTLRASCSDHEWSSPVAASLSRVVTQDGHTNQLEQRGGRERGGRERGGRERGGRERGGRERGGRERGGRERGGQERGGRCEREAVSIRHIFNLYFDV